MQTAAIPYRVADFLKQHPPFQFMDESELVTLASRGRVKFHEPGEYICWQSSPHTPHIFVIQQGSVSLWDETTQPATLRDMRGAGDIIGTERFHGSSVSLYSAKAASEVVIYALHAADLEPLLERYPQAALYVGAYSAVTTGYAAPGKRPDAHKLTLAELPPDRPPLTILAIAPIHEAARVLRESAAPSIILTNETGVTALLTTNDLLDWIADGAADSDQPASSIARTTPVTVAPTTLISDCTLAMAEAHAPAAVLTADGKPHSPIQRVITHSSLAPVFGDHPIALLDEINSAPNFESLRALHTRARVWILDHLSSPSAVDWLCGWSDLLNRRMLERLVQLTGDRNPDTVYCFYGAAGRRERLTSVAPRIAVIGMPSESLEFELAECGYLAPEPMSFATINEWKRRFSAWIKDPIRTQVYNKRPFFDLRPVLGPTEPFTELETHVRTELANERAFLHILANDCLSALPPLTFFRDLVVEESGEQSDKFKIEKSALEPLADVARVLSLAAGIPLGASTRDRFEQACRILPEKQTIFRDAAETMRLVLLHQATAGLRLGTNGAEIPLSILSRQDRQMLKSGFHAIHGLLEFTATGDWLEAV